MDVINTGRRVSEHRWLGAAVFSLVVLCGIAWFVAIDRYPVDDAVAFGMMAPECKAVGDDRPGSLLASRQPDSDVCRSYFIYHTTFTDAVGDPYAYRMWVMRQRVHSFWAMLPYVLIAWAAAVGLAACVLRAMELFIRPAAYSAASRRLSQASRRRSLRHPPQ